MIGKNWSFSICQFFKQEEWQQQSVDISIRLCRKCLAWLSEGKLWSGKIGKWLRTLVNSPTIQGSTSGDFSFNALMKAFLKMLFQVHNRIHFISAKVILWLGCYCVWLRSVHFSCYFIALFQQLAKMSKWLEVVQA